MSLLLLFDGKKSKGGDDAPPKKEREYLTRGELYELEKQDEQRRLLALEETRLKRLYVDEQLKLELLESEQRLAEAIRANDEALVLLIEDDIRRRIITLWLA